VTVSGRPAAMAPVADLGPSRTVNRPGRFTLQVPCRPCPHRGKKGEVAHPDGVRQVRVVNSAWTTREDAEKALAARQLGLEQEQAKATAPMTFSEACARYLQTKERKRSLKGDRKIIEHLKAEFGADTPITEITASRISAYKAKRLAAKSKQFDRPLSGAAVNRPLALLRHLLRLAHEEWEVLDEVPKIRLEKEPEWRVRYLDEAEIARPLAECEKSRNPYLKAIVVLAINTGMRKSEVMALSWDRIDFPRGVVRLERTKTGKRREIPMNDAVYAVLAAFPAENRQGLVFKRKDGRGWGEIRKAFEEALERAGIEDFRFHDLRHTCASWLVMRGASLAEVRQILGHTTLAMTMRYAHSPRPTCGPLPHASMGWRPPARPSRSAQSQHKSPS
jgi:integrase